MKDKLTTLIAGPTDKSKVFRFTNISKEKYNSRLDELADTLYKNVGIANIIPDQGIPFDLAIKFRKLGGIVVGYVPRGGCESLGDNFQYCDDVMEFDGGWSTLNTCLSLRGDLITVVGMSPGTIVEIAYTKYHQKYAKKNMPILMDEVLVPWKLPKFLSEELDLRYFNEVKKLDTYLNEIRGKQI